MLPGLEAGDATVGVANLAPEARLGLADVVLTATMAVPMMVRLSETFQQEEQPPAAAAERRAVVDQALADWQRGFDDLVERYGLDELRKTVALFDRAGKEPLMPHPDEFADTKIIVARLPATEQVALILEADQLGWEIAHAVGEAGPHRSPVDLSPITGPFKGLQVAGDEATARWRYGSLDLVQVEERWYLASGPRFP